MVSLTTNSLTGTGTGSAELQQLLAETEHALKSNAITQLRNLMCEVHGEVIVLRGQVDSYYLKQLAQETIRKRTPRAIIANLVSVSW